MSDDRADENAAAHEQVAEWIRSAPQGPEFVRSEVERFRGMTADERLDSLVRLQELMDACLGGRPAFRLPRDEEVWRVWGDPASGRLR
ncbi:MAG: hypothetical protein K8T90_01215 [Planctomycetes bacterium]|nr:hypothetical protein [Planctomycetota bacterium]